TRNLPAARRASDADGLRMLALATRAQRHQFQLKRMPPRTSVLIEDLPFNAMLAAANRSLERIARELNATLPPALRARFELTDAALDAPWDEASGPYYSRHAVAVTLPPPPTLRRG